MQRILKPLPRSFSDTQIDTLVTLSNQDLLDKKTEFKTVKENFKKLEPLANYDGKQLESLIQSVVMHIEVFFEHKDYEAVVEGCELFSKLNCNLNKQNRDLSVQLIKKTNDLLVKALSCTGNHQIACKIRIQQMVYFNNQGMWYETIQLYQEFLKLIAEYKNKNTFIESMKADDFLFQVYSLQIAASMNLKDHPRADALCEKQLSLAKGLYSLHSIVNSPEKNKYSPDVQNELLTKKQEIDIAAQSALNQIKISIVQDINQYNIKNKSKMKISEQKLGEIIKSIYNAEISFCLQECKAGLSFCEQALKDSKIPFIRPSYLIATIYYQKGINATSEEDEKYNLLNCINHCTQILQHFDYPAAHKLIGCSFMKLKEYAKAHPYLVQAMLTNDFNQSEADPLQCRESILIMLIECESNLLPRATETAFKDLDFMETGDHIMDVGHRFKTKKEHAEAKKSYCEAAKLYTEELLMYNNPGAIPCDSLIGFVFFKRAFARFFADLFEASLEDVQIAQGIFLYQINLARASENFKEVYDRLEQDIKDCEQLINAISFSLKNENVVVSEYKTPVSAGKKKKKNKKAKKDAQPSAMEHKEDVTPQIAPVLIPNNMEEKVTLVSKEQIQKIKLEEKKRDDARRKEIRKQNLEAEKKRQTELKELELKAEIEKARKAREEKEIKDKADEAARVEKEIQEAKQKEIEEAKQKNRELREYRKNLQNHKYSFKPVLQDLIKAIQAREDYKKLKTHALEDIINDLIADEIKDISQKTLTDEKSKDEVFSLLLTDLIADQSHSIVLETLAKAKKAENQNKLLQKKMKAETLAASYMLGETKSNQAVPVQGKMVYPKFNPPSPSELKVQILPHSPGDTSDSSEDFSPISSPFDELSDRESPIPFTGSYKSKSPTPDSKLNQDPYTPFYRYLQLKGHTPLILNLPSKTFQQLIHLRNAGLPFSFAVGGLVRDHLLGRQYGQNYKDKKEGDNDLLIPPTPFEKIKRSFPHATRFALNTKQDLIVSPGITSFYLYDVPESNKYKKPFNKEGSYQDIFDETQIKESPYFQGNFVDPMRAEMLSRDLEINSAFVDEHGRFYALPETIHALQHRLISIPNKLELLRMEANAMQRKFDESQWAGKTNEQIAYELDIRIFLRAMLALSHCDLVLSDSVAKSIPIGLTTLKQQLYSNQTIVKQINTLLQTKVFRHTHEMASRRFKIFTNYGINQILFPGLIETIQSKNLSPQLEQILANESSLEKTYCGFLVLQYLNAFLKLSAEEMKDDYFLGCFLNKLVENKPLLSVYFDNYPRFKKHNDPSINDIVRHFVKVFTPKAVPTPPKQPLLHQGHRVLRSIPLTMGHNLSMFSHPDELPDAAPQPVLVQPIPGRVFYT